MSGFPEAEELFTDLEGPDSWDNPAAWDILLLLDPPGESVLEGPAETEEEEPAPAAPLAGIRKALQDARYAAGRLCPLERCPWARQGVCVLCFRDWCPNLPARRKAADGQKNGGKACKK